MGLFSARDMFRKSERQETDMGSGAEYCVAEGKECLDLHVRPCLCVLLTPRRPRQCWRLSYGLKRRQGRRIGASAASEDRISVILLGLVLLAVPVGLFRWVGIG